MTPEGVELPDLERVDHGEHARRRHLDQAELAAMGVLGDELRVECEMRTAGEQSAFKAGSSRREKSGLERG